MMMWSHIYYKYLRLQFVVLTEELGGVVAYSLFASLLLLLSTAPVLLHAIHVDHWLPPRFRLRSSAARAALIAHDSLPLERCSHVFPARRGESGHGAWTGRAWRNSGKHRAGVARRRVSEEASKRVASTRGGLFPEYVVRHKRLFLLAARRNRTPNYKKRAVRSVVTTTITCVKLEVAPSLLEMLQDPQIWLSLHSRSVHARRASLASILWLPPVATRIVSAGSCFVAHCRNMQCYS